jgi:hypothetical protein
MNYIIVEGRKLLYAQTIPDKFGCHDCMLNDENKLGCVRIDRETRQPFFESNAKTAGELFCIMAPQDVAFINDTPEDIAKYVAARLDDT